MKPKLTYRSRGAIANRKREREKQRESDEQRRALNFAPTKSFVFNFSLLFYIFLFFFLKKKKTKKKICVFAFFLVFYLFYVLPPDMLSNVYVELCMRFLCCTVTVLLLPLLALLSKTVWSWRKSLLELARFLRWN